jgi:hypothetical protein
MYLWTLGGRSCALAMDQVLSHLPETAAGACLVGALLGAAGATNHFVARREMRAARYFRQQLWFFSL